MHYRMRGLITLIGAGVAGCAAKPPAAPPSLAPVHIEAAAPAPKPVAQLPTGAQILASQPGAVRQAYAEHQSSGTWPVFRADASASKITSPVSDAGKMIYGAASSQPNSANRSEGLGVQAAMASAASRAASNAGNEAATQPLSPFNGQQPGYNVRNGNAVTASPTAAENSGPGQLTYQPGKPGQHTKDIAVDVTDIRNRNGNGQDDKDAA